MQGSSKDDFAGITHGTVGHPPGWGYALNKKIIDWSKKCPKQILTC
jgi:hypothetical protein